MPFAHDYKKKFCVVWLENLFRVENSEIYFYDASKFSAPQGLRWTCLVSKFHDMQRIGNVDFLKDLLPNRWSFALSFVQSGWYSNIDQKGTFGPQKSSPKHISQGLASSFYLAFHSICDITCLWSVRRWRTMIPLEIFTNCVNVQPIIGVDDFLAGLRIRGILKGLSSFLVMSFFCTGDFVSMEWQGLELSLQTSDYCAFLFFIENFKVTKLCEYVPCAAEKDRNIRESTLHVTHLTKNKMHRLRIDLVDPQVSVRILKDTDVRFNRFVNPGTDHWGHHGVSKERIQERMVGETIDVRVPQRMEEMGGVVEAHSTGLGVESHLGADRGLRSSRESHLRADRGLQSSRGSSSNHSAASYAVASCWTNCRRASATVTAIYL